MSDHRYEDDSEYDDDPQNAELDKLDEYLEMLYSTDDFARKIRGSQCIMQLSRSPENLEYLVTNETLLNALGRELKEEGRKSLELMINILYVFYSFSHFTQFHQIITKFKIGGVVLKTIQYEERRFEELIARRKQLVNANSANVKSDLKKITIMLDKQDRLLYVCFHILLNLAEDLNSEMKMKKKNIIPSLVKCFDRRNPDLLILSVAFLKKLSIFEENKIDMLVLDQFLPRLADLLGHENPALKLGILKLLFNLSFDAATRQQMISIPQLVVNTVELLKSGHHLMNAVKLLYHLSYSETGQIAIGRIPNSLLIVFELIAGFPEPRVSKELIALAVNLVQDPTNCDIMILGEQGMHQQLTNVPKNIQRIVDRL